MTPRRRNKTGPVRWFRRYLGRPALLLFFIVLCMSGMIFLWPHKILGMPEDRWNHIKDSWRANADVVILGDSRAASSLLPRIMEPELPGMRIKNFAFPGNAYLPDYIPAGLRILDPASKTPTVIMSFSSKSLTLNQEGYPAVAKRTWSTKWKWEHIPGLLSLFEPVTKWQFINTLRGQPELGFWREFREDGSYVGGAVWKNRKPSADEAVDMLDKNRVDEGLIVDALRHVRELRARGVRVIGVRLPSNTEIEAIEDRVQEFDEAAFVRRFREAGGEWVAIPDRNAYQTYDLSHLEVAEAERFSRWFSGQMKGATPQDASSSRPQDASSSRPQAGTSSAAPAAMGAGTATTTTSSVAP